MGWKHYRTADYPKREPQVGSGLFGTRLLILHFKFQFTKSIKSSTFHIPLILTYPQRKNISFQKCPKITQKFTQNRPTVVNVMNIEIQHCLKGDRDIGRKAVLSHVKQPSGVSPATLGSRGYFFSDIDILRSRRSCVNEAQSADEKNPLEPRVTPSCLKPVTFYHFILDDPPPLASSRLNDPPLCESSISSDPPPYTY